PARQRREPMLEIALQARLGAQVIDQDDLAAGLGDTNEFIERRLGIRHRRDDELRHHHVEETIRETEALRIHYGERIDVGELVPSHALLRLAQHGLAIVHADDAIARRIVGERDAGADPDIEDAPAGPLSGRDRRPAAGIEDRAEHQIVDRRPARIGLCDGLAVELTYHLYHLILLPPHRSDHPGAAARPATVSRAGGATALWMMPPPSTRAWPTCAS